MRFLREIRLSFFSRFTHASSFFCQRAFQTVGITAAVRRFRQDLSGFSTGQHVFKLRGDAMKTNESDNRRPDFFDHCSPDEMTRLLSWRPGFLDL